MLVWDQLVELVQWTILTFAQACGGNLGWGVLVMSVTVRVVMLPLTLRIARLTQFHQRAMRKLKPELERIRKKYRSQPERVARETQQLFKKHNVAPLPLAGCIGALVQAPVFLAVYSAIRQVAARGGQFLWIKNLAHPDAALTLIVAAIAYLSAVVSATAGSPQEGKQALLLIPVAITVAVLAKMSAGVGLYWGVSAASSAMQSYVVRKSLRLEQAR